MLTPCQIVRFRRLIPDLGKRIFTRDIVIDYLEKFGVEVVEEEGVETAYVFAHRESKIAVYNPLAAPTVQQVGLSHELAHIILGHHRASNPLSTADMEWEATNLAWSMSVPRFVYLSDRLTSSNLYLPFAHAAFLEIGATEAQARDAAKKALAAAKREYRELSFHCRFNHICKQGDLCPFARHVYF